MENIPKFLLIFPLSGDRFKNIHERLYISLMVCVFVLLLLIIVDTYETVIFLRTLKNWVLTHSHVRYKEEVKVGKKKTFKIIRESMPGTKGDQPPGFYFQSGIY